VDACEGLFRICFSVRFAVLLSVCGGSFFTACTPASSNSISASVLDYHNGPRRNGVYIDPTLTKASAKTFHVDPAFKARIRGAVYAQLLYVAGGASGKDMVIVVSEANNVTALGMRVLAARSGAVTRVSLSHCGICHAVISIRSASPGHRSSTWLHARSSSTP
jgi:hypothetical protein